MSFCDNFFKRIQIGSRQTNGSIVEFDDGCDEFAQLVGNVFVGSYFDEACRKKVDFFDDGNVARSINPQFQQNSNKNSNIF